MCSVYTNFNFLRDNTSATQRRKNVRQQSHRDANVNATTNNGGTAMMEAADVGHTEVLETLAG
jgi:ankyrin repeat protein